MDIKTFNCKVGLVTATTGGGVKHRGVAITSPRTGRTIKVWDVMFGRVPARVPGRVAQAVSRGLRSASFTADELRALLSAARELQIMNAPKTPMVFVNNTPGKSFARRRNRLFA